MSLSGYSSPNANITVALKSSGFSSDTAATNTFSGVVFNKDTNVNVPNDTTFNGGNYTVYYTTEPITTLSNYFFNDFTGLLFIHLGANIISLFILFYYQPFIKYINVDAGNPYFTSIDGVLYNKNNTALIRYPCGKSNTNYIIPEGVTSIGRNIDDYYAFAFCSNLISITMPSTLTIISNSAFSSCASLTSITIPINVREIGTQAFYECTSLTSINVDAGNQYFTSIDGVLYNKNKTALKCYPAGKSNNSYISPDTVTSMDSYSAFANANKLQFVYLPNVTIVNGQAFIHCTSLTYIYLPNVTMISGQAFQQCKSLRSIYLPKVTSINSNAFYNCSALKNIYLPIVTSINSSAFSACTAMTVYTSSNNYLTAFSQFPTGTPFPTGSTISTSLPASSTSLSVFTINGMSVINNPNISVLNGTTSVTVVVTPADPFASYTITGNTGLQTGSNTLTVRVTAGDQTAQDYVVTITVNNPSPTINALTIPATTFGIGTITLTNPTSTSSGVFTYTSSDTTVASISGNTVTILKAGTTTITATQAATTNFASGSRTATLTVNNPSPTINAWTIPATTFGVGTITLTNPTSTSLGVFTYTSSDTTVASISGYTVTILKAGTTTITATQAATTNFASGSATATLRVNDNNINSNLPTNNNVYLKQLTDNTIWYSTINNADNNTSQWTQIPMTCTITNTNATPDASNLLVVTFLTDLKITNVNQYFIIGSDYVTIDGGNKTVTISGVTDYPGFIQNGTGNASNETKITNGKSNIIVQNIKISSTNSTLMTYGGWICQAFYGNSSSGTNIIQNCTNNNGTIAYRCGGIAGGSTFAFSTGTNTIKYCSNSGDTINSGFSQAGGIVGRRFARSSSGTTTITNCSNSGTLYSIAGGIAAIRCFEAASRTNKITDCSNTGNISGQQSGGIAGQQFAQETVAGSTNTIERCSNIGIVSGASAGGIAGLLFAYLSSGTNKIIDCSNSGDITNNYAGGIAGQQFAQETTSSSINTIEKCSNIGNISGQSAGGIAGMSFAIFSSSRTNKITDCSNNGVILGTSAGGIAGAEFAESTTPGSINTIEKCSNSGDISGIHAGGIAGSAFALSSSGTNKITDCSNRGIISGPYAGGIAGSAFALSSSGTNKITDCTNNGIISGNSAGGISGKFTGYNSSGINTITNCVNSGDISGNFTGGISGGAIAYTDISNIRPSLIISNSYSIGIIRNTTDNGGICAGYDGKDLDASNNFIDASYATTATATIKNCYSLYGNIKAPVQSDKVTFNITNTYEANGSWSSNYALRNLLLKDASNAYVWAYQRVNGTNQSNSPFVLYSLNPTNTYVSLQVYDLNPNQIVGITDPNSNVVITNTSNNQTFTRQSNSQGSWFFTPVNRANSYIFKNANQVTSTLTSTYSFRYPQSKYTLSTNTPILIKPRQNGTNQEDQRSWRISPKLPEGLKFSGVTGIITGTPIETSLSTTYNIWSNSEVFLSYRRQLTIEIV